MTRAGNEITEYSTVKQLINDSSMKNNNKQFFYMLKMPDCGGNRIKIGKSSNIYQRFKYYNDHFYNSSVRILFLRSFNKTLTDRYGDNSKMLYALFEQEAKKALKKFNNDTITEWFSGDKEYEIKKAFREFVDEFGNTEYQKNKLKEKSTRERKAPEKYKP